MPSFNQAAAVNHLRSNAEPSSTGHCAQYVREAINAGGVYPAHTPLARNYGGPLLAAGFYRVDGNYPQKGDVVVIQAIPHHPAGHMAMYDGQIWISDFRQYHGFYPSQSYRDLQPPYQIYRHD
ncbi:cytoplasmic protein [Paraburkholderia acidicola]|uniref:Cytoplasmic protein n=1 Tax=Paraburkholderia acidicola TaxID=1912599 RepID=A0A2A4F2C5_9BURK|nr:CHAP domain-containing protein [Paraburkholderia acidicola]PCE27521.1 cytoplasmic protein [Paraburkholderia acidicola]